MPQPTLIQQTSQAHVSQGGSLSVSFASLPVVGNYIIATVATVTSSASSFGFSDNQGNTYSVAVRSTPVNDGTLETLATIWYAKTTASAGTFTVTATSGGSPGNDYITYKAYEYSNLSATTSSVLSTTGKSSASSTTLSITITVTTSGLAIGAARAATGTSSFAWTAPGAPWTNLLTQNNGTSALISIADYQVVTSGDVTISWGLSSAVGVTGALAHFIASGARLFPQRLLTGYGL